MMKISTFFSVVFLGLLTAGWSPAHAASSGYALSDVNMRSGPGVRHRVKTVVPRRSGITIRGCRSRWCQISWRGLGGWVSRQHIAYSSRYRPPRRFYNPPLYEPFGKELLYDDGVDRGPPLIYDPRPRRPGIERPLSDRPKFRLRRPRGPKPGAPNIFLSPYKRAPVIIHRNR